LAEIETLSSSLTKAEASIAQLTERLIEKEATLGKVLAERLKYIQQQLTLKEQLKVEANRAEKEHELSQQISHALTAARNQVSELQSQLEKMSSEMRIVRKQADIARLGAEKSAAEAYTQRQFAESAQSQVRRLSGELAQLHGQIEQQTEALRAADEAKTRSERRVSRLEHELELLRKRNAATSASDVDWQHEMIEDMRRKLYCTVCKAQEKQVTLLRCLHMFCRDCIQTNIANRNRKCPLCGEKFGTDDVKPIFFV
jgi:E3 ubiquitin-protein ligase BRE1